MNDIEKCAKHIGRKFEKGEEMAKQYRVNGMLQNMAAGSILPHEFIVSVSNDTHCTVSIAPNNPEMPVQYCVDFTDVLRDLKKGKRI